MTQGNHSGESQYDFMVESEQGAADFVIFNVSKIYSVKNRVHFHYCGFQISNHLDVVGWILSVNLNFRRYVECPVKKAVKRLCVRFKVRQYFMSKQFFNLYKAQVRSCMQHCCYFQIGSDCYYWDTLDWLERFIDSNLLVKENLQSLEHRHRVARFSIFYWIQFGKSALG